MCSRRRWSLREFRVGDGVRRCAYVAGHTPISGAQVLVRGTVGGDLTLEDGYCAARLTGLSILASLKDALGDLDRVERWLRAVGYVYAAPGFHDNAKVVNGALLEAFS